MAGKFIKGKNATLLIVVNGQTLTLKVKNFRVKEEATEGEDSVCGEDRDRPFIVTNFYRVTFSAYQRDASTIAAWLAMLANEDADVADSTVTCGVAYKYNDGTHQNYMLRECTRSALDTNQEGRTSSVMFESGFRGRYYKATQ